MKLSQIKGADAIDVLARIIEPIANIALDKEALEAIKLKPVEKEGKTPEQIRELALQRIREAIPAMLGNHRMDICEIMAAINGKTCDEYVNELTFGKLLKDCMDVLTDNELLSFFN